MNLPFFIARRYFLSSRKQNFINIISILSMAGVAFTTAALIIVLSVFNGLGELLRSLNASFDPELKIESVKGKSFEVTEDLISQLQKVEGVEIVTQVIEDYAYVKYMNADMVVTLKGVSENFLEQHRLDDHIVAGELKLSKDSVMFAIIGRGVHYTLSVDVANDMQAMRVIYVKNPKSGTLDPSKMYSQKSIRPGSVFAIEKNYDENYIFVPLSFARELLGYGNRRTSLEVQTDGQNPEQVKSSLQSILGDTFQVLTNEEQHKDLYRLLKIEKLFTFLSLSLLILVGSINIFFSLMMLVIDKKKDISILTSMGASSQLIRKIFLAEGGMISFVGAAAGLFIGALLCFLQQTVGLVGMGMENAILNYYPVRMEVVDFLLTGTVILTIAFLVSYRPAVLAARSYSIEHL